MRRISYFIILWALVWGGCAEDDSTPTNPSIPAPRGLSVAFTTPDSIGLIWTDSSDSETGYRIERSTAGTETWTNLANLSANSVSYIDRHVTEGAALRYRLRILQGDAVSPPSNEVAVRVALLAPTVLLATTPAELFVLLQWTDVSQVNWGYEVFRRGETGDEVQVGWANSNAFIDSTIILAETFTYRVRAAQDTVFSSFSNETSARSPFYSPTNLAASRRTLHSAVLTWKDSSRVEEGYELERKIEGGVYEQIQLLAPNSTTFIDTGLTAATTYSYRIRAVHERQLSAWSNESRVTTSILTPAAPSNLTAESRVDNPGRIILRWIDNASNETGYAVQMKWRPDGIWEEIAQIDTNSISYQSHELIIEEVYYFRVYAFNLEGPSDYSNIASSAVVGIPPAPKQMSVILDEWRATEISWVDKSRSESGFRLERNTPPGVEWILLSLLPPESTMFRDTTIQQMTAYFYRVAAYNDVGVSGYADSVGVVVGDFRPAAPSDITTEAPNWFFARIGWRDNSSNENGFHLERKAGGQNEWSALATPGENVETYIDSSILAGANYLYRVRAFNDAGVSEYALEVAVQIPDPRPPIAPTNLVSTEVTSRCVTLGWEHNDAVETGFCVQRKNAGSPDWLADSTILPENTLTYTDRGVQPESGYVYRVRAFNENGNSDYSNELQVVTSQGLIAPANLTAVAIDVDRILLAWQDRADNEVNYFVERSPRNPDAFEMVAALAENSTVYLDTLLDPETQYFYRVNCRNDVEDSDYSNTDDAVTPSLTVFFDDFEDYEPGDPPGYPWEVQTAGTSRAVVVEDLGIDGSRCLNLLDPDVGQNYVQTSVETTPTSDASLKFSLWISTNSYLGIIGGDASGNAYITWQIQFNQDNSFFVRDGSGLIVGGEFYPVEEWFELEVKFNTDSSRYFVSFDGEAVTDTLSLQRNDHSPNGSIYFLAFNNEELANGYIDNVHLERVDPRGEQRVLRLDSRPSPVELRLGTEKVEDAVRAFPVRQ